jgi:hypothetical protein
MAVILGLTGTESHSADRFTSIRRKVFYSYPNGAAPLAGILSVLNDGEAVSDPEFSWYEKRLSKQTTPTVTQGATKGPFLSSAGADLGDPAALAAGTEYRVTVTSTDMFRVGHQIKIQADNNDAPAGPTTIDVYGVVTVLGPSASPKYIQFRATSTHSAGLNNRPKNGVTNENVGKEVLVVGSAFAQGAVGSSGNIYNTPVNPGNYCQILRTEFSISGTALKTSLKYDETGPYKDKAKEHSVYHMVELEKALLFGQQSKVVDGTTNLPTYTMGGILWFLAAWEATTSNIYGQAGATLDSDDDKRIITNSAGTISESTYDGYLERLFRQTNNTTNEKLCLCGSGALSTINSLYKSKSVLQARMGDPKQTYGMDIVSHLSPFGTIHYKTHPLLQHAVSRCAKPQVCLRHGTRH